MHALLGTVHAVVAGERSQLLQEEQAKHWQQTVKAASVTLLLKILLLDSTLLLLLLVLIRQTQQAACAIPLRAATVTLYPWRCYYQLLQQWRAVTKQRAPIAR
jgi:hypothetical protein